MEGQGPKPGHWKECGGWHQGGSHGEEWKEARAWVGGRDSAGRCTARWGSGGGSPYQGAGIQPLPWGSSRTHQSAGGCERLRDPGGEWAADERAWCPQPRTPGHGGGRGEHGGSLGLAPEGPELDGSCGHRQPGGEAGGVTGEQAPAERTVKATGEAAGEGSKGSWGAWHGGGRLSHSPWQGRAAPV